MAFPQATVAPSAAKRIRNFDCWVFRDELLPPLPDVPNGALVELIDRHSAFLGYAFSSARSHIAARVVSTDRDRPFDRVLLRERLAEAIARRAAVLDTNAKRLVFSEADGLPGLIVDQYADRLVVQIRSAGLEPWRDAIVDGLRRLVHPNGILERSDKEFREEEGLPPLTQVLAGTVPERIEIEESGLRFLVDPHRGQKTGFYLDQRRTRQRVRELVRSGEHAVDVCAYTGACGIAAASRGARVICVEQEEGFLALARENAKLNRVEDRIEFVAGDAFYWLAANAERGAQFDWVLLDPPSLAKGKADLVKGRQALHHLTVHALALLAAQGTLVLSVCTYHLLDVAEDILRIAAGERGLRLRIRELAMQAADHPWILQMPMTRYLMSWLAQRDGPRAA